MKNWHMFYPNGSLLAGRVHGIPSTLPVNTARRHGPWTQAVCTEQSWTRPCWHFWQAVFTGVYIGIFWPS